MTRDLPSEHPPQGPLNPQPGTRPAGRRPVFRS